MYRNHGPRRSRAGRFTVMCIILYKPATRKGMTSTPVRQKSKAREREIWVRKRGGQGSKAGAKSWRFGRRHQSFTFNFFLLGEGASGEGPRHHSFFFSVVCWSYIISYMGRAWLAHHYSRSVLRKSARFLFIVLVLFQLLLRGDGPVLILAGCVGVTFVSLRCEYFS